MFLAFLATDPFAGVEKEMTAGDWFWAVISLIMLILIFLIYFGDIVFGPEEK